MCYLNLSHTASSSTAGSLEFTSNGAQGGIFFFRDRTGYQTGETATLEYVVGHVDDDMMDYTAPTVTWLKDGVPVTPSPTNTPDTDGSVTTTLSFTFAESDAGVYQVVFTDTSRSEVFVSVSILLYYPLL